MALGRNSEISMYDSKSVQSVQIETRVYKRRWFLLAVIFTLNSSNAMNWCAFTPIPDITKSFFHCSITDVNLLSLVFFVAYIPLFPVGSFLVDYCGLRTAVITSCTINAIGAILSFASCYLPKDYMYTMLFIGKLFSAVAQALTLMQPTKLAAVWFKEDERATANSIASLSNQLGLLVANVAVPIIVPEKKYIPLMLGLNSILPVAAFFMSVLGFTRSEPLISPSQSRSIQSLTFKDSFIVCVKSFQFWVLFVVLGIVFGIVSSLIALIDEILCTFGYSNDFAGDSIATFLGTGLVGAIFIGMYADKTNKLESTAKSTIGFGVMGIILFSTFATYAHCEVILIVSMCFVGIFGLVFVPLCLELAVECTYPAAEATSSGLLLLGGQLFGSIFMVVLPLLATNVISPYNNCGGDVTVALNYRHSLYFFELCNVISYITFMAVFKSPDLRKKAEMLTTKVNN